MKVLIVELLTVCLVVITGLTVPPAHPVSAALEAPPPGENMLIRLEGDRLAVSLKEAPLKAVLEEIGRQGRIEVTIQGPLTKTISLEFHQLPLEEGLRRLLRGCGWMTVGRRNGKMEQLVVAETPEGLSRTALSGDRSRAAELIAGLGDGQANGVPVAFAIFHLLCGEV